MSTSLTTIFDTDELVVTTHPAIVDRLYSGFAGASGLVAMWLGKRGRLITIEGRLKSDTNSSYSSARADLLDKIYAAEELMSLDAADYTYQGETMKNLLFDRMELLPSYGSQYYAQDSGGYLSCKFVYYCRSLSDE